MKKYIVLLFVCIFALCSCGKDASNPSGESVSKKPGNSYKQTNDTGSKTPKTDEDGFPVAIPIDKVKDTLNPFKILGEVKRAKLVYHNWITGDKITFDLENPARWPKLLFAEYENVVWDCKYICNIIFETSTGTHNVHLEPIQCELGEYEKGKTRLRYNFAPEFKSEFVKVLKSKTKPDEPHNKDNLNAAFLITKLRAKNSKDTIEAIQLMKDFLKDNDEIDEEVRESINNHIRWHSKD